MGATEVTLEQYRQFDPEYLNGVYDMHYKDQVKPGYLMDSPDLPVIRKDLPDTWIFGVMSMPQETAMVRNLRPRIPAGLRFTRAQAVNLRGEKTGPSLPVAESP